MALSDTVDEGRLAQLVELKGTLARAIDMCDSMRDLAALSRQYRETLKEIELIEGGDDEGDEIAAIILRHRQPGTD